MKLFSGWNLLSDFTPLTGIFRSYWVCLLNLPPNLLSQWWCNSALGRRRYADEVTHESSMLSLRGSSAWRSPADWGLDHHAVKSLSVIVPARCTFHAELVFSTVACFYSLSHTIYFEKSWSCWSHFSDARSVICSVAQCYILPTGLTGRTINGSSPLWCSVLRIWILYLAACGV